MKKLLGISVVIVLMFSFSLSVFGAEEIAETGVEKVGNGEIPALYTDRDKVSYILGQNIASSIDPFREQLDIKQFMIGLEEVIEGKKGDPTKLGYAFGRQKGNDLSQIKDEYDVDLFLKGVANKLDGMDSPVTDEEVKTLLTAFSEELRVKMEAKQAAFNEKNKADGEAFLEENKDKEGVITTWSGLQYKVLVQGEGPIPKSTDLVKINFKNTLIDGTVLGSGSTPLRPANNAISGWTETILLMNQGSKFRVFIPSGLAYGEKGYQNRIPPNTVIISELELIEVQPVTEPVVE